MLTCDTGSAKRIDQTRCRPMATAGPRMSVETTQSLLRPSEVGATDFRTQGAHTPIQWLPRFPHQLCAVIWSHPPEPNPRPFATLPLRPQMQAAAAFPRHGQPTPRAAQRRASCNYKRATYPAPQPQHHQRRRQQQQQQQPLQQPLLPPLRPMQMQMQLTRPAMQRGAVPSGGRGRPAPRRESVRIWDCARGGRGCGGRKWSERPPRLAAPGVLWVAKGQGRWRTAAHRGAGSGASELEALARRLSVAAKLARPRRLPGPSLVPAAVVLVHRMSAPRRLLPR
eukprot:115398-Chlamydomonas_euryale.AAC.2